MIPPPQMLEALDKVVREIVNRQPENVEWKTVDGMFIKQMHIRNAGSFVPQHAHVWPHTSLLAFGSCYVWKDGALDQRYSAPAIIYIDKGVKHTFMSLVDDTVIYCLHNLKGQDKVAVLEEHELTEDIG